MSRISKALLEQLIESQKEIDKLNIMTSNAILSVEDKYEKLRKPLYKKRNQAIKRLPNFWATSFVNHPIILRFLGEQGLGSIRKLKVENLKKINMGYRIHIYFYENPYFKNKVLTKEIRFGNAKSGDWTTATSTNIKWKKGMSLQRAKQNSLAVYKTLFEWFSDTTYKDFDFIGDYIRDDLWVNPLRFYCKEAAPEDTYKEEFGNEFKMYDEDEGDKEEYEDNSNEEYN
ncbi:protein SET-like [Drosophila kikkawai]|uniref:Protein SET-like n=1 Tax=Drosophila kikkawai TaxID=30033 RepID=A0A6P4IMB2_DROKI|nr:protein SET-like [Drosophila kikkawai]